jgi:2'-hydroxyisoflavone reductase
MAGISRRDFVKNTAALSGLATVPFSTWASSKPLKLLILGGTGFLGPHTVQEALSRGHEMTLFNRGQTNTHLFPELEKLRGDRDGKLEALAGRKWDAVVDTSGYVPRLVAMSANLLAPNTHHYLFISTISVYADFSKKGMDETAAVGKLSDETTEKVTGETYGPLKALCETAAQSAMPGRNTIIRPGLIAGPGDKTDRFSYWPVRVKRGGDVLAPGDADDPVQFIDVRDLASFIIDCLERRSQQVFNADRPAGSLTMGKMLDACKAASGSDARFRWADASWLQGKGVQPWSDMPVWIPATGEYAGFGSIDTSRARAAGLRTRPVLQTAQDTLEWFETLPAERQATLKAGLTAERETTLLADLATLS